MWQFLQCREHFKSKFESNFKFSSLNLSFSFFLFFFIDFIFKSADYYSLIIIIGSSGEEAVDYRSSSS